MPRRPQKLILLLIKNIIITIIWYYFTHFSFNAVVSKTVNKHGDHAFSIFGQTRHFLPITSGIKINHFFPSNDYHYQQFKTNVENEEDKPVNEQVVDVRQEEPKNQDTKETVNKMIKLVSINADNANNKVESDTKQELIEETPVEIEVPEVISNENVNLEVESASKMPIIEEPVSAEPIEHIEDLNINKLHKEEPHADSEVASSYYHSKIYYVGF